MRRWLAANRLRHFPARPFCSTNKPTSSSGGGGGAGDGSVGKYEEAYRQLDKLDFMTAAKILFTNPPQKKKFGLDFHFVQFFFACMPSLAVYLVAQYARYEMRRMEAELETKKKAEEAAKAKEDELKASEEKEDNSIPDLLEVKLRLDNLEVAVKEIAIESKKQLDKTSSKSPKDASEKKEDDATNNGNKEAKSEASNSEAKNQNSKQKSEKNAPS